MIEYLIRIMRGFVMLAVLVIFCEVLCEVFARYVLLTAVPWGAELSQTLLVWMTFIGACCAFHKGHHMGIDYLVKIIPSRPLRNSVIHLANLIMATVLILGFFSGAEVVSMTWADRTTALQIPGGVIYLAFPVSMAFMLLLLVDRYVKKQAIPSQADEAEGEPV